MHFGPYVGVFLHDDFWKMIFWLVLKLEISYWVVISWTILVSISGFFWRFYFHMVKYLNFDNSSFAFEILFNVNGKATVWHTPRYPSSRWENWIELCHNTLVEQPWVLYFTTKHEVLFIILKKLNWPPILYESFRRLLSGQGNAGWAQATTPSHLYRTS
jgi:hypothetical protein